MDTLVNYSQYLQKYKINKSSYVVQKLLPKKGWNSLSITNNTQHVLGQTENKKNILKCLKDNYMKTDLIIELNSPISAGHNHFLESTIILIMRNSVSHIDFYPTGTHYTK